VNRRLIAHTHNTTRALQTFTDARSGEILLEAKDDELLGAAQDRGETTARPMCWVLSMRPGLQRAQDDNLFFQPIAPKP